MSIGFDGDATLLPQNSRCRNPRRRRLRGFTGRHLIPSHSMALSVCHSLQPLNRSRSMSSRSLTGAAAGDGKLHLRSRPWSGTGPFGRTGTSNWNNSRRRARPAPCPRGRAEGGVAAGRAAEIGSRPPPRRSWPERKVCRACSSSGPMGFSAIICFFIRS